MAKQRQSSQDLFSALTRQIKNEKLLPVYFLCGEEQFFTDQIQEELLDMVPPESKDFNFDMLYGQDVTPSDILGMARSYPMMSERRFVFVREFFQCIEANTGADGEEEGGRSSLEAFIPYFENPAPFTVLVMHDFKKPNKNSRFYKALNKSDQCGYFQFDSIPEYKVADWISSWTVTKYKREIDARAAEVLYQIVGTNLHKLSTELEKIHHYRKAEDNITLEDVKSVVGFTREFTAFELQSAVFERNTKKAMFIAEQMLQQGNTGPGDLIPLIALFHASFWRVWQYKRLVSRQLTPDQISSQMGMSGFRVNMISKDARRYQMHELPAAFEALLDADRAVKGFSKLDASAILVMLLKRLIKAE